MYMIKTLLTSLREYRDKSLLTVFCSGIEAVFEILIPVWMARLIDEGIQAAQMQQVWIYGSLLLFFACLQAASGIFAARLGSAASAGFAANLRADMFDQIERFSFANIDKFSTSSLVTRLTTDVTNLRMAFLMLMRMAVRSPMMMIAAMAVSFSISPSIAMIFVAFIPIMALALALISWKAYPLFQQVFKTYDQLNNVVEEDVRGIRVVKSFTREDHEIGLFSGIADRIRSLFMRAEFVVSLNGPLMQLSMFICIVAISWVGAHAVVASGNNAALGLTTGGLTALFTYGVQILMSLMMITMVFTMIIIASASAKRIAEVLREQPDIVDPDAAVTDVANGEVCFNDVAFAYSDSPTSRPVLEHVDLHFPSGATIGIIGGTGSSKSSLVQLIPRLYDVTEGSVTVAGVDVRRYSLQALREAVAMVLQKDELFGGTIAENLRWGDPKATDDDLVRACRAACADDFIRSFPDGYQTRIEQGGVNVSGGQKQRLCIARALLKKPKILILDDSTSAVDTITDAKIQAAFRDYIPETTKIIIAQRISSVSHADQIVVLDEGRVNGVGTHEELLRTNAIYREVYESQQKAGEDA